MGHRLRGSRRSPFSSRRFRGALKSVFGVSLALLLSLALAWNSSHGAKRPSRTQLSPSSNSLYSLVHSRPGTVIAPHNSTTSTWSVTYPIEFPAPYHSPTGIATDPGGGVWLFAQGGTRQLR